MMIKVFPDDKILAKNLALEILKELKKKKRLVLGCPGGRSLKKTYYYLGILSYSLNISLNNLIIIMMDEYAKKKNSTFCLVDKNSHYSCVRFCNNVIKKLLNYKKNQSNSLKKENIYFPTAKNPQNYDLLIKKLGGIDIFLLASGSTDGHVAFNNADSKLSQKTHITKLSIKTRSDNMKTFPKFKKISEVPKYGLTVGLHTISKLSKNAILVMTGKEKKHAFKKISFKKKFTTSWPSSIIYKCKKAKIYIDKEASFNS